MATDSSSPSSSTSSGFNQSHHGDCSVCQLSIQSAYHNFTSKGGPIRRPHSSNPICSACKKFYFRHRSRALSTLHCSGGRHDCLMTRNKSIQIGSGVTWRMVCKRCRLARSIEVMDCNKRSNSSVSDSEPSLWIDENTSSSVIKPALGDALLAEFSALKKSSKEMCRTFDLLNASLRLKGSKVEGGLNLKYYIGISMFFTYSIMDFGRNLTSFRNLSQKQQLNLMGKSASKIALVLVANSETKFIENSNSPLQMFPELGSITGSSIVALQNKFHQWQPQDNEMACLLATILSTTNFGTREEACYTQMFIETANIIQTHVCDSDRLALFFKMAYFIVSKCQVNLYP